MARHSCYLIAVCAALLAWIPCTLLASEVPAVLPGTNSPWPRWVAADVAVAQDGSLRSEMLGQFIPSLRRLALMNTAALSSDSDAAQDHRVGNLDQCRVHRGAVPDYASRASSLTDLSTKAAIIVTGEVVATREGFYGGLPGTLLLLSARYMRGTPATETFLFYPHARIATADGLICAKPPGDYVPPQVGDRVLILALGDVRQDSGRAIFRVSVERELVHESRFGVTRVPDALRSIASGPAPFDRIEKALGAEIATASGQKFQ